MQPNDPTLYSHKSLVHVRQKDHNKVVEECGKAIEIWKKDANISQVDKQKLGIVMMRRADSFYKAGKLDESIAQYKESLAIQGNSSIVRKAMEKVQ